MIQCKKLQKEQHMKKKKIIKKVLIALLIIVIIIILATIGIGNYFVNYAIARSGNGGDRQVKDEVTLSQESEDVIQKNRKEATEKAETNPDSNMPNIIRYKINFKSRINIQARQIILLVRQNIISQIIKYSITLFLSLL